jgi:hypothetical protein
VREWWDTVRPTTNYASSMTISKLAWTILLIGFGLGARRVTSGLTVSGILGRSL